MPLATGGDGAQVAAAEGARATVMEVDTGLFDIFDPVGTTVIEVGGDGTIAAIWRSATPTTDLALKRNRHDERRSATQPPTDPLGSLRDHAATAAAPAMQ